MIISRAGQVAPSATRSPSDTLTATTPTNGTAATLPADQVSITGSPRTASLADATTVARTSGGTDVASMNPAQKLGAAIQRALPMMPADVRDKIAGMVTPENLAIMGGITVAWAASHAVGVGEVADLAMLGIGALTMGPEVVGAAKDFAGFVGGALNAKSEADLDGAARHFSHFVSTVGVDGAAALLLHKAGSDLGGTLDRAGASGSAVVEAPGVGRIRVRTGAPDLNKPLELRGSEPRGSWSSDEASGGHTIREHIGKTDADLRGRLRSDPTIETASTFTSEATASRAMSAFRKQNAAAIERWLNDPRGDARFTGSATTDTTIGRVMERGRGAEPTSTARFVIERDPRAAQGWHVVTAYPTK